MNNYLFHLQPFTLATPLPEGLAHVQITGSIARSDSTLSLCYILRGPLEELVIPALADQPTRQDNLWQTTCFEFFLALQHSDRYWEFNLSPAGHWNIYRFVTYRQGMEAEMALTSLPFNVQTQTDLLRLALDLNLKQFIPSNQALVIGISAVVQLRDGAVSYWALTHPGPQADFHRRDSFTLMFNAEIDRS